MDHQCELTDDQVVSVLRSLRRLWVDVLWIEEADLPTDPDESLYEYFERTIPDDSLSHLQLIFELERLCGEEPTRGELLAWVDSPRVSQDEDRRYVDQYATRGLRGLAEWVWQRCPTLRVEPFRIGTVESMPAGVFVALETFVGKVAPDIEFGPSSSVRETLTRRQLQQLLNHEHSATGLPRKDLETAFGVTEWNWSYTLFNVFLIYLVYMILLCSEVLFARNQGPAGLVALTFLIVFVVKGDAFRRSIARLLPLTTFGDVSRHIARELEGGRA